MTHHIPTIEIQNLPLVRASVVVMTPFHRENMLLNRPNGIFSSYINHLPPRESRSLPTTCQRLKLKNLPLVRASVVVMTPFHQENMLLNRLMAFSAPISTIYHHVNQGHDPPHANN